MYYYVQSGDSMHSIAMAYNTTVRHLMHLNPHIRNPHRIHVGERIKISSGDQWGHEEFKRGHNQWSGNESAIYYTVVSVDTLNNIATKYGTTVSNLMSLNSQITNANQISIGEKIKVSSGSKK